MAERVIDAVAPTAEPVDEELVALTAPPNTRRLITVAVMAITAALCIAMLLSLRQDLSYFASETAPTQLGKVNEVSTASLPLNRFVELEGAPMLAHAAKYRTSSFGETRVITPFAGQRGVLISLPESQFKDPSALAGHRFTGRLIPMRSLSNMDSVKEFLKDRANYPVGSDTLVFIASDAPREQVGSVLLALLALAFIVINLWLIVRWFKPLPVKEDAPVTG